MSEACLKFDSFKISKILSEKVKEANLDKNEKYQLISLRDDALLIWSREEARFYSQILQRVVDSEPFSSKEDEYEIQILSLSKPPIWEVSQIISNKSGTGVLLIGKHGVAVVELPKRWGSPPLFEGGVEAISCRVEYIGEQFFTCNQNITIVSADWHPGSIDHKSVIVLSSDNYLRIYSLSHLDIPEQAIPLSKSTNLCSDRQKLGIEEYAVAFGIGPPLDRSSCEAKDDFKNTTNMDDVDKLRQNFQDLQWPIFLLYNNGDVYYLSISLCHKRIKRKNLYGPLSMVPSSFDNYGLNYCSLIVLPSSPIVLVIANSKGYLHHCVVMENIIMESKGSQELQDIQALSDSIDHLNLETSNMNLHVYESVHINLSVADSLLENVPVLLLPDPNTPARYFVLHNEGVHGVSLPLVERLLPEENEFPDWDLECCVEHIVCTRPIQSIETCSVVGLALSVSPCRIFVLLSSGSFRDIPLPSIFTPNKSLFSMESQCLVDTQLNKELKSRNESFQEHIKALLQRTSSQPLLMSGSSPEIDAEEYLSLVSSVTDTLRKNYIQPQLRAREQIQKRRNLLLGQNDNLLKEIQLIEEEKHILTKQAHELAEKYEETNDRHLKITKRLELVIGHLVRQMPTLSSNERAMIKELEDKTEMAKSFANKLNQINFKYEWQQDQIKKQKINDALQTKKTSLSDNQMKCLKMSLSKESEKLANLIDKIKQMKKECGM